MNTKVVVMFQKLVIQMNSDIIVILIPIWLSIGMFVFSHTLIKTKNVLKIMGNESKKKVRNSLGLENFIGTMLFHFVWWPLLIILYLRGTEPKIVLLTDEASKKFTEAIKESEDWTIDV